MSDTAYLVTKEVVDQIKPLTPKMAAMVFAEWDDKQMAEFFNELAKATSSYDIDAQLWQVKHNDVINEDGQSMMDLIGDQ